MDNLNFQQKIAMMRILLDILNADGIDVRETFFFNQLMSKFSLNEEDKELVEEKNSLLALVQIRNMSPEQKDFFSELMTKMIIIDGDINVNEVAIYEVVSQFCNIEKKFEDHDLPEGLTYS